MKHVSLSIVVTVLLVMACGRGTLVTSETQNPPLPSGVDCSYSFKKVNLCASIVWIKKPTLDQEGSFKLAFTDTTLGDPRDPGYTPIVVKRMPDMACDPVTLDLKPTGETGVFEGSISLGGMPGKTEIWVRLESKNTLIDEAEVNYTF
jgi:hypothetical protein